MAGQSRVLVLVATNTERDALLHATRAANATPARPRFLRHHTVFEAGSLGGAGVFVAQCEQGMLSPGASTLTAHSLIDALAPDYFVITGICYGLREGEQLLGDIVVATQLRVLDHKKVIDPAGPDGGCVEVSRGDRVTPSVTLLDRFRAATVTWKRPMVHLGPVLSFNTLLNSAALRSQLIEREPDAIAGEMEGGGVYAAAAKEWVDWILVKAISDWGVAKTDAFQAGAARAAADFVVQTIRGGGLAEAPHSGSRGAT